jgi:hypothetical protein
MDTSFSNLTIQVFISGANNTHRNPNHRLRRALTTRFWEWTFSRYRSIYETEGLSTQKNPRTPSDFFKKIPKKSQKSKNQKIPKIPKFQEFWFNKSTKFYKNRFFSLSILIPLTVLIIPLGLLSVSWSVCCQCHARNFWWEKWLL